MCVEKLTNEDIVLLLVKKGTEHPKVKIKGIQGKKALQKSLYFFNQNQGLFSFRWGDYGPLSNEIQQIVDDVIRKGSVNITQVPTQKEGIFIQQLQYSNENNSYFEDVSIPDNINRNLDEIVDFISEKTPRELELLASVHFWATRQRELMGEYSTEYVLEKLTNLKPQAQFTRGDVESAIDTLEEQNYLRC